MNKIKVIHLSQMTIAPSTHVERDKCINGKGFKAVLLDRGFNVSYMGSSISETLESANCVDTFFTVEFIIKTENGQEHDVFDQYLNLMGQVLWDVSHNSEPDTGIVGCDIARSLTNEVEYVDDDDRWEMSRSYAILRFESVVINYEGILDDTGYAEQP